MGSQARFRRAILLATWVLPVPGSVAGSDETPEAYRARLNVIWECRRGQEKSCEALGFPRAIASKLASTLKAKDVAERIAATQDVALLSALAQVGEYYCCAEAALKKVPDSAVAALRAIAGKAIEERAQMTATRRLADTPALLEIVRTGSTETKAIAMWNLATRSDVQDEQKASLAAMADLQPPWLGAAAAAVGRGVRLAEWPQVGTQDGVTPPRMLPGDMQDSALSSELRDLEQPFRRFQPGARHFPPGRYPLTVGYKTTFVMTTLVGQRISLELDLKDGKCYLIGAETSNPVGEGTWKARWQELKSCN